MYPNQKSTPNRIFPCTTSTNQKPIDFHHCRPQCHMECIKRIAIAIASALDGLCIYAQQWLWFSVRSLWHTHTHTHTNTPKYTRRMRDFCVVMHKISVPHTPRMPAHIPHTSWDLVNAASIRQTDKGWKRKGERLRLRSTPQDGPKQLFFNLW